MMNFQPGILLSLIILIRFVFQSSFVFLENFLIGSLELMVIGLDLILLSIKFFV